MKISNSKLEDFSYYTLSSKIYLQKNENKKYFTDFDKKLKHLAGKGKSAATVKLN